VECEHMRTHYHRRGGPGGGAGCCWCGVEKQTGVRLFGGKIAGMAGGGAARLAQLWDSISSIPKPEPGVPMQAPKVEQIETESVDPLGRLPRIVLSAVLATLGLGCLVFEPGRHLVLAAISFAAAFGLQWRNPFRRSERPDALEIEMALAGARKQLAVAVNRWNSICHDQRFDKLLEELTDAKRRLMELPHQRDARRRALLDDAAKRQRDLYLDRFRIDKAKLKKLWPQELTMLASYGIETAEDALRLQSSMESLVLKGTFHEIIDWAHRCAADFRFDPNKDLEGEDLKDLEETLRMQEDRLLERLKDGEADLKQLAEDIAAQRTSADAEIRSARRAINEAEERT
jgi:DNA-binding helix-hairpin-helix protein with protein kinase domain